MPTACAAMRFAKVIIGTEGDDTITGTSGNDLIFEKVKSNLQEVNARDGVVIALLVLLGASLSLWWFGRVA